MKRKLNAVLVYSVLSAFAMNVGGMSFAQADAIPPTPPQIAQQPTTITGAELSKKIDSVDENTLRDAAVRTADQIRKIPEHLREKGIQVSPADEARYNEIADRLVSDAQRPGLKSRVKEALGKVDRGLRKAGIYSLEGVGYASSAVVGSIVGSLLVGEGFFVGLVKGRKAALNSDNYGNIGGGLELGRDLSGILSFYYAEIGLSLLLGPAAVPLFVGGLMGTGVSYAICQTHQNDRGSTMKAYCSNTTHVFRGIARAGEEIGAVTGGGIHAAVVDTGKVIIWPFRHLHRRRKRIQR